MGLGLVGFLFLCGLSSISSEESSDVRVIISGNSTIAQTNEHFVCATLDWWPSDKCDYNQCSWGQSSILNLDLNHPFLAKAIRAFSPLRIRVGGTLQDKVVYGLPNLGFPCLPFSKKADELYGFSEGCLSLSRWNELNLLFEKTGAIVIFGLNALSGRYYIQNGVWGGPWNSSNARDFIEYTISKGYPVDSWEFGNELGGQGIGASVGARQYGKDAVVLRHILDELYQGSSMRPLLVAPGGIFEQEWYGRFLKVSGSRVVDVLTHHIYNLGAGNNTRIVSEITDPQYLNQIADTYKSLQRTIKRHGKWVSAWVSEAGGVYNSGSRLLSNKFINSFWYLDQLGMASKYNTKVYCRQTLIGGNYGLLDTETFVPNPDYYSALLWHRLMGKGVLSADIEGSGSPFLRAYAHCRKQKEGVTLILINLSNSTQFNVSVGNDINRTISWVGSKSSDGSEKREEYHLTAKDGNYLSQTMLLNGRPLELTGDEEIPALDPALVAIRSPVFVAPLSIAFVVFPNFEARACL